MHFLVGGGGKSFDDLDFSHTEKELAMLKDGETYAGSVYRVTRYGDVVWLMDTGNISAHDGERYEHIPGLAVPRTTQTDILMTLLKEQGIPVAHQRRMGGDVIEHAMCEMLPVEFVRRRVALGSYLERYPKIAKSYRFHTPIVEIFHKRAFDLRGPGLQIVDGNRVKKQPGVYMDPLIIPEDHEWAIYDAHAPLISQTPLARIAAEVDDAVLAEANDLVDQAFGILEHAFGQVDVSDLGMDSVVLADFKLEVGRRVTDGALVIADVVNLDSMRLLRDGNCAKADQISKQTFRDGGSYDAVRQVYELGTEIIGRLAA